MGRKCPSKPLNAISRINYRVCVSKAFQTQFCAILDVDTILLAQSLPSPQWWPVRHALSPAMSLRPGCIPTLVYICKYLILFIVEFCHMNKIRYLLRHTVQVLGVLFCDWCNLLILFIVRFCHMNKINRLHMCAWSWARDRGAGGWGIFVYT